MKLFRKIPFRLSFYFCLALFFFNDVVAQDSVYLPQPFYHEITRQALQNEQKSGAGILFSTSVQKLTDVSGYDALYYDLDLTISTVPQNLQGVVTGIYRSRVDGLTSIQLDFDSREGLTPWQDFSVSGDVAGFIHADNLLTIQLDRPYNIDETFTIRVRYSGLPRASGLKGFEFDTNQYGNLVVSTLSEPYAARTWWPCKDDPSDKADSVHVRITVPQNLFAVSNGLLVSETDNRDATRTYSWKTHYPITTYLVSLAIANYAAFSDSFQYAPGRFMPIEYYVYPEQLSTAKVAFAPIRNMLEIYSGLFGLYPFIDEKYGQAVFEWGGAMEHQTITSVGRVRTTWEYVYAHELSHQWFGDLVTCENWGDIWLNEGFAHYCEALYEEQIHGTLAYHDYIRSGLSNMENWATEPVYRYNTDSPGIIFRWTVYEKGSWVLHMLRHILGDTLFFRILKDYPNDPEFRFRTVTTAQFEDFCERQSGMDLDWFFQQWIYEPYFPVYLWDYQYQKSSHGHSLYLQIRQTQKEVSPEYQHLYTMPIDIRVNYVDGTSEDFIVWDSREIQTFTLVLDTVPQEVLFDPDEWILKKAERGRFNIIDPGSHIVKKFRLEQNFPNPFNSTTQIHYELFENSSVLLEIFNVRGQKVKTLVNGIKRSGYYEAFWDGRDDSGETVASGLYIYRLSTDFGDTARKMILLR